MKKADRLQNVLDEAFVELSQVLKLRRNLQHALLPVDNIKIEQYHWEGDAAYQSRVKKKKKEYKKHKKDVISSAGLSTEKQVKEKIASLQKREDELWEAIAEYKKAIKDLTNPNSQP